MTQKPTTAEQSLLDYLKTKPEIKTVSVTNFAAICELTANLVKSELEQNKMLESEDYALNVSSMAYDLLESLIAICISYDIDLNNDSGEIDNESMSFTT